MLQPRPAVACRPGQGMTPLRLPLHQLLPRSFALARADRSSGACSTRRRLPGANRRILSTCLPALWAYWRQPPRFPQPVAAAIARTKAKAEGKSDPLEEAKSKVASLEKRLSKSEEKLANAQEMNDDNVDAFAVSVEKLKTKLEDAKAELLKLEPEQEPKQESNQAATATTPEDDPVAAAIARAKAKAEGTLDPKEAAQSKVSSLEKRLAKSEEKLATAREMNDDNVDAFAASVEKLKEKLEQAKLELDNL